MNERRIETAKRTAVIYRNYRRARERALTRLAQAHPEIYKELLEQEKANDEAQGRKWLDIDGNTSNVGTQPITTVEHSNEASNNRAYKSNDGGEA
jgi:hypothetical protein